MLCCHQSHWMGFCWSLMTPLLIHLHILHSWKEMLERRTASASPWFRSPAPCDLWKASQQRQKRIETNQTSKSWSACHICHRWETSGKKESSVQMRFQVSWKPWASESSVPAGRGWATYGAALVPVPPRHRIKYQQLQVVPERKKDALTRRDWDGLFNKSDQVKINQFLFDYFDLGVFPKNFCFHFKMVMFRKESR